MKYLIPIFLVLLLLPALAFAVDPYWVSPTGAEGTWANCQSATPLSGTSACSITKANSSLVAGDLVYLRGGTYTSSFQVQISPTASGTGAEAKITYEAYTGETPVFEGDGSSDQFGFQLRGDDWIVIRGITFKDQYRPGSIWDGADYNEVDSCTIYHSAEGQYSGYVGFYISDKNATGDPATHNWIHNNTIHTMGTSGCNEGYDLMKIGSATNGDEDSDNNTIENNVFYYAGHALLAVWTRHNVIRGNVFHNEGWKIDPGGCTYGADPEGHNPGDGKYGHRGFVIGHVEGHGISETYNLVEANRSGYASANPSNNGAENMNVSAQHNIIRYNYFFGADGPGVYFKWGDNSSNNRFYNNTVYGSGNYIGEYEGSAPMVLSSIHYTLDSIDNVFKNNIFNSSVSGDLTCAGFGCDVTLSTWGSNLCKATDSDMGCTAGTPSFVDTDMSDMTSLVLPNLHLNIGSSGVNGGESLTLTNGTGTDSVTLIVDDAQVFQDGTWGSSISNIQPDHIAITTVGDTVAISSINYDTNTITLASAMTWTDGVDVWLYSDSNGNVVLKGDAPDQGAYETGISVIPAVYTDQGQIMEELW